MEDVKRLNKFIAETGFCSRREADRLIEEGRVTINGVVPEMGTKVTPDDEVRIDGRLVAEKRDKNTYLAFNKPVGIECTTNLEVQNNIVDYIHYHKRIFPIGRLDKASEGLIFMTDDGDIVNKILRARNNHEKEYIVTVNRPITDRFIQRMGSGVPILETVTRKCHVEQVSKYVFKIILTQGLNRQIRRMCEYLGYDVTALKRTRIINISLDVPVGTYRELTQAEITELNTLIEPSSKTEEASLPPAPKRPVARSPRTSLRIQPNTDNRDNAPSDADDYRFKRPAIVRSPKLPTRIQPDTELKEDDRPADNDRGERPERFANNRGPKLPRRIQPDTELKEDDRSVDNNRDADRPVRFANTRSPKLPTRIQPDTELRAEERPFETDDRAERNAGRGYNNSDDRE